MFQVTVPEGMSFSDYSHTYGIPEEILREVNPGGSELVKGQTINIPIQEDWMKGTGYHYQDDAVEELKLRKRAAEADDFIKMQQQYPMDTEASHIGVGPAGQMDTMPSHVEAKPEIPELRANNRPDAAGNLPEKSWLRQDESFSLKPYTVGNANGGVTIATGVDLGSKTPEQLRKMGVAESTIQKLMPAFGKKGKEADAVLSQIPSLSQAEADQLDEVFHADNVSDLKNHFGQVWDQMSDGEKGLAISLKHQYGNRFYDQKAYQQMMNRDIDGLKTNLLNWGDDTEDLGPSINARYARYAGRI